MTHINIFESHELSYVCSHIFENSRPILLVSKEDGEWQFLCGGEHEEEEIPKVVGLGHLIERDNTLLEILNLEDNWEAERKHLGSSWKRAKI